MSAGVLVDLDPGRIALGVFLGVPALVAFLGGCGYLFKRARGWVRIVTTAAHIINHELQQNTGSSVKDDVDGTARAVRVMGRILDDHDERLDNIESRLFNHPRGNHS